MRFFLRSWIFKQFCDAIIKTLNLAYDPRVLVCLPVHFSGQRFRTSLLQDRHSAYRNFPSVTSICWSEVSLKFHKTQDFSVDYYLARALTHSLRERTHYGPSDLPATSWEGEGVLPGQVQAHLMDLHGVRGRTNRELLGEGNGAMKYVSLELSCSHTLSRETGDQDSVPQTPDTGRWWPRARGWGAETHFETWKMNSIEKFRRRSQLWSTAL
jgi:hypothetical protein